MIQTSGFFTSPTVAQAPDPGLELLYESKDGYCVILKGHRNDRIVAYKALNASHRGDPVWQRMLRREYEIGASLKHPGICEVLSWTRLPGYGDCIEMEYIDGLRLDDWLARHPGNIPEKRRILSDLCGALSYIHRKQVAHKDLKPENILITRSGNYPKIIDFGLSDADTILTGKEPAGTVRYAAPEVLQGMPGDARSDIYSLGVIMCGMGSAFSRIARRCMAADPSHRYASAEDVRSDLEQTSHLRTSLWLPVVLILAILAVFRLCTNRQDRVEHLFQESVEKVREAANPS